MKTRAEKRSSNQALKCEKRNKKLNQEEIDTIIAYSQEDLKKKETFQKKNAKKSQSTILPKELNAQKKDSNINIFTEGISYEKIDHKKYNKALSNFNKLFTKDLNKTNKQEEQKEKKGQISKKFLYQRALYKGMEIEIKFNQDKTRNSKSIDEIISLLNKFFITENNFVYYEYSNTRNISFNKLSEGDMFSFRYFYKNYENVNVDNNYISKEEYIKQLDYANTLNDLIIKYNVDKKLFYIITPLYTYSFNYNKDIPLLITSSKTLESQLKRNGVKIIKFKKNQNKDKDKDKDKQNKGSASKNNNDKSDINDEEEEELDNNSFPIGISQLYVGLLYNLFVNQNMLKPFNIFSDYEFEGCLFRKCKTQIVKMKKNIENNSDYILVKVEGVIFEEGIQKMIDFFKNKIDINNFNIRLNKIKSTGIFYKENKEIETSFDRLEFRDNNFHFYKQ